LAALAWSGDLEPVRWGLVQVLKPEPAMRRAGVGAHRLLTTPGETASRNVPAAG
jgi:hypothetical protein